MRILLYEYTCSGGLAGQPGLNALRAEGEAMLAAVWEDFACVPKVEALALLDQVPPLPHGPFRLVAPGQEESIFREEVRRADAALIIAPEIDGILAARCRWAEEAGIPLLGPSSEAVRLCADKLALGSLLREHGVATPECRQFDTTVTSSFPAMLKPRNGAGSQATFLVRTNEELVACGHQARAEGWAGELMVQDFVTGFPASVAFLRGPRQMIALLPAAQLLSSDGRFHYLGGELPLSPDLAERAIRVAQPAVEAVPGLQGYVGVDVVLGSGRDWVIEINPRLTTSYLGLRSLAKSNLAAALLSVVRGTTVPDLAWHPGRVRFSPSSVSRVV